MCISAANPLLTWNTFAPYGAAVAYVQWVESCSGLFLVQDSFDTVYMWWVVLGDCDLHLARASITFCCVSNMHRACIEPGCSPQTLFGLYNTMSCRWDFGNHKNFKILLFYHWQLLVIPNATYSIFINGLSIATHAEFFSPFFFLVVGRRLYGTRLSGRPQKAHMEYI